MAEKFFGEIRNKIPVIPKREVLSVEIRGNLAKVKIRTEWVLKPGGKIDESIFEHPEQITGLSEEQRLSLLKQESTFVHFFDEGLSEEHLIKENGEWKVLLDAGENLDR
jgi:hypothetical protein